MKVSVIIATFNRAAVLERTLCDMSDMDFPDHEWELLIADNNSSDRTSEVVNTFHDRLPIKYVFEQRQGKNWALNAAIELAAGSILVFTDDDISPESNWLQHVVGACRRWPHHDVFGGTIIPEFPEGTPQYMKESEFSPYVYAGLQINQKEGPFPEKWTPNGPNCCVRRSLFDQGWRYDVGIGPRERGRISGSELEFFGRLRAAGHVPVYVPHAVIRHRITVEQTTIAYLLRRSFGSGCGHQRINGANAKGVRQFLGAPRHLYRQIVEATAKAVWFVGTARFQRAFEQVMRASLLAGCVREAWRN